MLNLQSMWVHDLSCKQKQEFWYQWLQAEMPRVTEIKINFELYIDVHIPFAH